MTKSPGGGYPLRAVENVAVFGGTFTLAEIAEYVGGVLHGPQSPDFTQGDAIVLGLVVSGIATAIYDHMTRERDKGE